jgi:acyl-CoA synthetase (NDP forming)/RimJ/RimL family protein N-acetyltransferase
VVLRDGATARIRPIRPDDTEALREFHEQLSSETVYFRYFAPHPELTTDELFHLTNVDYIDRVALVVIWRGDIIGVGRFERMDPDTAEVAFVIRDDVQGRGVGSLLLEHLAAAGRERGYRKFIAEVLPQNGRMLATFRLAGFVVDQGTSDGVVHVRFDIAESDALDGVRESRQQRSEARSLESLLEPQSIAIVGVSRRAESMGNVFLVNLVAGGFTGQLFVVHPEANHIRGIPCVASLAQIPEPVDVVVIAVPATQVAEVIKDAAHVQAKGIVVVSSGFDDGSERAALGQAARSAGMRLLGPAAYGIINTRADISANCSLKIPMPKPGVNAFFCQSGALGADTLRRLADRGLGLSSFISAGHRADVSGNDALQYWYEDEGSRVILMHLETLGNPRKFAQIVARVSRRKPVIAVRTLGARAYHPWGHQPVDTFARGKVLDQLLADTGLIEVDTVDHMLDVAQIINHWGVVAGDRIGIVGNSEALEILARNAAEQEGLRCTTVSWTMSRSSSPDAYRRALDDALRSEDVDIVVALHVPPVESTSDQAVSEVIAELAGGLSKPVIGVVVGADGRAGEIRGSAAPLVRKFPVFNDVEQSLRALASVVRYAHYVEHTHLDEEPEIIVEAETQLVRDQVALLLQGKDEILLDSAQAGELLETYGLALDASSNAMDRRVFVVHGIDDLWMGRMVGLGVSDPLGSLFGQTRYAWASMSTNEAYRLAQGSDVLRLLEVQDPEIGRDLAEDQIERALRAVAEIVKKVGALMHDVPQIVGLVVRVGVTSSGDAHILDCSVEISRAGTDRPWATRSLPPVTG